MRIITIEELLSDEVVRRYHIKSRWQGRLLSEEELIKGYGVEIETKETMTNNELMTMEVGRRYAGEGWAFVQDLGDDMGRVIGIGKTELGSQVFLVWKKLLKQAQDKLVDSKSVPAKLSDEILQLLSPLRKGLKNGTLKVVKTRIVNA